jgi:hypothetical protein
MPLVRQIAGHGKQSVTLDVYSQVLLDEPAWRLEEPRRAVGAATGLGISAAPLGTAKGQS